MAAAATAAVAAMAAAALAAAVQEAVAKALEGRDSAAAGQLRWQYSGHSAGPERT